MDPRIGMLMREGRPVYYAHLGGEFPERASPEAVLALLEGRAPVSAQAAPRAASKCSRTAGRSSGPRERDYVVTVRLKYPAWDSVPAELPIRASSAREALSLARQQMAREAGHTRQDGPLLYRARRAE